MLTIKICVVLLGSYPPISGTPAHNNQLASAAPRWRSKWHGLLQARHRGRRRPTFDAVYRAIDDKASHQPHTLRHSVRSDHGAGALVQDMRPECSITSFVGFLPTAEFAVRRFKVKPNGWIVSALQQDPHEMTRSGPVNEYCKATV